MADIPPDDGAYPVVADAAPLLPVQPELAWDLGTETRDAVSDVYLVTFARLLPGTAEAAGLQDIVFTRVRVGCLSRLFTHACMHSWALATTTAARTSRPSPVPASCMLCRR